MGSAEAEAETELGVQDVCGDPRRRKEGGSQVGEEEPSTLWTLVSVDTAACLPLARAPGLCAREIKSSFTQLALPCCMSPDNSWAPRPGLTPPGPQLISQSWAGGLGGRAGDRTFYSQAGASEPSLVLSGGAGDL